MTQSSSNHLNDWWSVLPPMTASISVVSLKGARSNLMPPGAMSKQKPKSMCRMWPASSIMMLPLWRSLNCSRYEMTE